MKKNWLLYCLPALLLIWACGGDDSNSGAVQAPMLEFPENNSECFEGVVSSTDPESSTVEFRWATTSGAGSYQLNIRNLITGESTTQNSNSGSLPVQLKRATPYSWDVVAFSASNPEESAQSETWKFYNAGEGISSYVPFPADIIYPPSGASVSLNGASNIELKWKGTDLDNDITNYEVLFGTVNPPVTSIGNTGTNQQLIADNLTTGTTYYWRVITTDGRGNRSESEVSEFRTAN